MRKIKNDEICRVEFTFSDGTKQLSHWEDTYEVCKRRVNTYRRQDKKDPYAGNAKYRIVKAR